MLEICSNQLFLPQCAISWSYFYNLLYSYISIGIDRFGWPQFKKWARSCGIASESELLGATDLLQSSGVLVHLYDATQPLENSCVILSAQWLADIMACFITTRANFINNGILEIKDLPRVLSDTEKYPQSIHDSIINLLEKFKIIYRQKDRLIIPSMLAVSRPGNQISSNFPTNISPTQNTIGRTFEFPSLPLGFFERLEVCLFSHPSLEIMLSWKTGTLLKNDDCKLLVEYDDTKYELHVLFRYSYSNIQSVLPIFKGILAIISNMIIGFYPGLNECTNEYIICPHCIRFGINNENIWKFNLSDVVKLLENGDESLLHCNNLRTLSRAVSISRAAPDLSLTYNVNIIPSNAVTMGKLIGEGGAGSVYSGIIDETHVAIKQLHIKESHDLTIKYSEFLAEASVMR